jgi:hypothetical protein
VVLRADAGYFAGALARAAHDAHICFAIGAKRIAPLWRLLAGIGEDDWHDAIDMDGTQVAEQGTVAMFESFEHSGPRGRLLLNASLDSSDCERQGLACRGLQGQPTERGGVDVYYAA